MLHTKRWRLFAVLSIVGLILLILFKINFISVTIATSSAERGKIFDQNGVILATNKKVKSLYCTSNDEKLSKQDTSSTLAFFNQFSSEFQHDISTDVGSSGSPVILLSNSKVIGIHKKGSKKFNLGTFIGVIIDELNKMNISPKKTDINNDTMNYSQQKKTIKIILLLKYTL